LKKLKQKIIKENSTSDVIIKQLPIIENDFSVEQENLPELISRFEKKISLNKGKYKRKSKT
jgi:hypothetical protein